MERKKKTILTYTFLALLFICNFRINAQEILNLQKTLQIALDNNLFIQSQQLTIDASQADIQTAKLYPNPVFSNQTIQITNPSQYAENTNWTNPANRQVLWQLNQPIMLPGQRRWRVSVANKSVDLAQSEFGEYKRGLLRDVAQKWLDAWGASHQLNILEIAKANIDTLVNINKLRVKNQSITETELVRAELLANQYDMQIKSARQDYQNKLTTLQTQLAFTSPVKIDTTDTFLDSFGQYDMDSLVTQATVYRSDVQSLQNASSVAESNIKLQKSLAWPQPQLGVLWNPQNSVQYWGFFVGFELPLFSRNQGEIKKSAIQKRQVQEQLSATRIYAQNEITNAYNMYQVQKENVEQFNKSLDQSEQILSSVKYAYLHGGTTIIDFLEAQRSWLDTRLQYYNLLQQYRNSYIDVLYTSGLINRAVR